MPLIYCSSSDVVHSIIFPNGIAFCCKGYHWVSFRALATEDKEYTYWELVFLVGKLSFILWELIKSMKMTERLIAQHLNNIPSRMLIHLENAILNIFYYILSLICILIVILPELLIGLFRGWLVPANKH